MAQDSNNPPSWVEPLQKFIDGKLANWGIPGALVGIALNHARKLEWHEFAIFLGIAVLASLGLRIGSKLLPYFDKLLDWILSNGERLLLSAIAELTDSTEGKYYKRLVSSCQDFEGRGFNAGGLSLENVYVPLKLSQRSAQDIAQDIVSRQQIPLNAQAIQDIGNLITQITRKQTTCNRLVILGAPGSGKSTLVRHITLMYAIRKQRQLHRRAPKRHPILLRLRDVYQEILTKPDQSLADLTTQSVKDLSAELKEILQRHPRWFDRRLRGGKCLVMLDGLDEIADDDQRRQVSQWVDQQLSDYYQTPFILTSRPDAYKKAPLHENAIELEVQPFTVNERNTFIKNWCINWRKGTTSHGRASRDVREKAQQQAKDLMRQIDAVPSLRLMASNPLLLSLMVRTHIDKGTLAPRRVELYRDVCQVLLEGRQRFRLSSDPVLSANKKQEILQILALEMTKAGVLQFTLDEDDTKEAAYTQAKRLIQDHLERVPKNTPTPEDFVSKDEIGIRELLSDRQQEGIYEFAHRTFQEYLTAVELKRSEQINCFLQAFRAGEQDLEWWRESIRFYAAQTDATGIIQAALDHPSPRGLTLAYECLQDTEDITPEVQTAFEAKVEQGLVSENIEEFKLAATIQLTVRLNRLNPDDRATSSIDAEVPEIIDSQAITRAEYALACLHDGLDFNKPIVPPFESIDAAKNCVTSISIWDAYRFCAWLSQASKNQFGEEGVCYRPHLAYDTSELSESEESLNFENGLCLTRFRIPERYSQLAYYLAAGLWREADEETLNVMLQVAGRKEQGYLNVDDIRKFPCHDLRIIDRLWVTYSNSKFGFSVQKQIWLEVGGWLEDDSRDRPLLKLPRALQQNIGVRLRGGRSKIYDRFSDRVGWRVEGSYISDDDVLFNTQAPRGHLPVVCVILWNPLRRGFSRGWDWFSSLASRLVKFNA